LSGSLGGGTGGKVCHVRLRLVAFVVLGLVPSVGLPSQDIGWEEFIQNDLFCLNWDAYVGCLTLVPILSNAVPYLLLLVSLNDWQSVYAVI